MSSLLRRRPRSPSAPPPAPLEDGDLLSEILARLPPQPSSLPRASAVCKQWRGLVTDPRFVRRFRLRHRRTAPLLGFFRQGAHELFFIPTLEAPNRVQPGRFSLQLEIQHSRLLGCRHGLALILDRKPTPRLLVWDPVTGEQHKLAIPPELHPTMALVRGAVLRSAAAGAGDVQVQHFKVVLLAADHRNKRMLACVYSSETGVWGNLISRPNQSVFYTIMPAVLVENSFYWLFGTDTSLKILEFDLERQSIAVVQLPPEVDIMSDLDLTLDLSDMCSVMRAEGGGLGFLFVSYFTAQAQLWKRKTDCNGVVSWELTRAIQLDKLLSLNLKETQHLCVLGYAEHNNVLLLQTLFGIFTVHLESLQFKKVPISGPLSYFLPFESVYTAGIDGGHGGAELLHNA